MPPGVAATAALQGVRPAHQPLRQWAARAQCSALGGQAAGERGVAAAHGRFDQREVDEVSLRVAASEAVCLVAHGAAVRQLSGDPELGEMMALNYRVAELEPRQRTMLDFVHKLTTTPHLIDDSDRDALSHQGFSNEDIFDIAETTAFFNLSNRMASATDMMPNREYHRQTRA